LDLRFREAEEEERKTLFTGVMRAYFRDDATIKEITEEEKFGHTFPRLEDGDLETIRSSMGTRILLSTVEVKRKQHHIVHGDEWGGNFLVKKNNDVYFIDFEDALYCQKETDKIETVGGDLSSRIFYKTKERKGVEKRFSLYGLGICGSLGRLLAALIQYECRPNGNLKGRFRDDEIKPTITCFLDSFNEAPGHDGLERGDLLMYRNQILAYAWDWSIYWNEKNMWRSGTFDIFEKIIKELLEEEEKISIKPKGEANVTIHGDVIYAKDSNINTGDGDQSNRGDDNTGNAGFIQSGDNNSIQITSGGDAIAAIGEGAIAAKGDITINHGIDVKEHAEILAQNALLEEKILEMKKETFHRRKEALADEAVSIFQGIERIGPIDFFDGSEYEDIANAAFLVSKFDISFGYFKQALRGYSTGNDIVSQTRILNSLGRVCLSQGNYSDAEDYFLKCKHNLSLAEFEGSFKASVAGNLGITFEKRAEYISAERLNKEALDLFTKSKDEIGIADSLNNLGIIYEKQGMFEEALIYHLQSLDVKEKIQYNLDASYNNMGVIYEKRSEFDLAIQMFEKSLEIRRENDDAHGIATSLNNLGVVFTKKGDLTLAMQYHKQSLEQKQTIGDLHGEATSLANLGVVAEKERNYETAEAYFIKSLQISHEINDQRGVSTQYSNLAEIYAQTEKHEEAEIFFLKGLSLAKRLGELYLQAVLTKNLRDFYEQTGREEDYHKYDTILGFMKSDLGVSEIIP